MSRWCTLTLLLLWSMDATPALAQYPAPGYADGNGVMPAGYSHNSHGHGYHAANAGAAYGMPGPIASGPGQTIYEQLPDDQGWLYEDSPLERVLKNTFRHSYFRAEYLLWDISDPGDNILGANSNLTFSSNTSNVRVPVSQIPIFELVDDEGLPINVVQPNLGSIHTNQNNGIRGTFGVPVGEAGVFEASVFSLQSSTSSFGFPDIRVADLDGDGQIDLRGLEEVDTNGDGEPDTFVSVNLVDAVAQAVLIDGRVPAGDNFLLINDIDYDATLKTSAWGAEGNFIFAPFNPNNNLVTMPMIGFRYFNLNERLNQTGVYNYSTFDIDTGETVNEIVTRRIGSSAMNNIYGPQIGMRAELRNKWFSLGAQPKFMLGLNSYRTTVSTSQVLSPDDPSQQLYDKGTTLGLIGDLEVYSKVHFGDHLSCFVAYNLMWAGLITRPADNIVYNIRSATGGLPAQSDFGLDVDFSGAILQGLSVGAQIEY